MKKILIVAGIVSICVASYLLSTQFKKEPSLTQSELNVSWNQASLEGNKKIALRAAKLSPVPAPYFVEARFGLWADILQQPMPEQNSYALGMWHYARGMAFANTGNLTEAIAEASSLQSIINQSLVDNNLGEKDIKLLSIGTSVLYASIADKYGEQQLTFDHLIYAMHVQDTIEENNPPAWYFPIKQAIGDAYLKWGQPQNAKSMYELDLAQNPENGWSLFGLEKSLRALGQVEKADIVHAQFEQAWEHADIPAPVSLF